MKKILILAISVFSLIQIYAQDNIDPMPLFNKNTLDVYDHRGNQFVLGFNWSSTSRALDQALNINCYHAMPHIITNGDYDTTGYITDMGDSIKDIEWLGIPGRHWYDWKVLTGRVDTLAMNGETLYLNPATTININDNTFQLRWNDSTGGIFGFKYHNWTVGDTESTGADQHRFILSKDDLIGNSAIVLDSIWDGSILNCEDFD